LGQVETGFAVFLMMISVWKAFHSYKQGCLLYMIKMISIGTGYGRYIPGVNTKSTRARDRRDGRGDKKNKGDDHARKATLLRTF